MGRTSPRQIDYQRMIRAMVAEGVPVDKMIPVVGVHGLALLPPGAALTAVTGEDGANEWDEVLPRQ